MLTFSDFLLSHIFSTNSNVIHGLVRCQDEQTLHTQGRETSASNVTMFSTRVVVLSRRQMQRWVDKRCRWCHLGWLQQPLISTESYWSMMWHHLTQLQSTSINSDNSTVTGAESLCPITPHGPFSRDHQGEPVPEENFWTLWCKGRLTQADIQTIRLGATPSGLNRAHLHHPPYFLQARCPSCRPSNSVKALKATSTFGLGRRC